MTPTVSKNTDILTVMSLDYCKIFNKYFSCVRKVLMVIRMLMLKFAFYFELPIMIYFVYV